MWLPLVLAKSLAGNNIGRAQDVNQRIAKELMLNTASTLVYET